MSRRTSALEVKAADIKDELSAWLESQGLLNAGERAKVHIQITIEQVPTAVVDLEVVGETFQRGKKHVVKLYDEPLGELDWEAILKVFKDHSMERPIREFFESRNPPRGFQVNREVEKINMVFRSQDLSFRLSKLQYSPHGSFRSYRFRIIKVKKPTDPAVSV